MRQISFLLLCILLSLPLAGAAQSSRSVTLPDSLVSDSLAKDPLKLKPALDREESLLLLEDFVLNDAYWRHSEDALRYRLQRLLEHSRLSFDSIRPRLEGVRLDTGSVIHTAPELLGSERVHWLNDSSFVFDNKGLDPGIYFQRESRILYREAELTEADSLVSDSLRQALRIPVDTLYTVYIDSSFIHKQGLRIFSLAGEGIEPSLDSEEQAAVIDRELDRVLFYERDSSWRAAENSPFDRLENPLQLDSLQSAMETLLAFSLERDSTLLWLNDMYGHRSPVWLSGRESEARRFWVKNYNNDSVTLWVGNPARNELSLILEDDVSFSRLMREEIEHLPEFVNEPERNLFSMEMLDPEPVYWDYSIQSSFTLNQTYLSENWSKGGESSFSTMLDVLAGATYNNKDSRVQWINTTRLRFGTIASEGRFRKNNDIWEIASKYNRNAWGKMGLSATFYWKNQLARGYEYPDDTTHLVSKFLSPSTMTVGLGAEYKPIKNTVINFAPLSFKTTFVADPEGIHDVTKHGIPAGLNAYNELGMQLVATNKISPIDGMTVNNRLRLFSNILDKPQNIDVDWEMVVDQKIAWFFNIRLNLHLIYDDDMRSTLYDDNGQPVLNPDGSEVKVARTQFKEFIGLSMQFKF